MKLVCLIFFLGLISKGLCQCRSNDVKIDQSRRTGRVVGGKPQWKVTLSTDCICPQTDVKLFCGGFQTVEELNPSIISKSGDACSLTHPVRQSAPTTFTYAWDTPFGFKLISSYVACS